MKYCIARFISILVLVTLLPIYPTIAQSPQLKSPLTNLPPGQLTIPKAPPGKGIYVASNDSRTVESSRDIELLKQSVPPGKYWVVVKGVIANDMNRPLAASCGLHDGNYAPSAGQHGLDYVSITLDARRRAALTLTATYVQSSLSNRTLRVTCRASKGARANARWFKLTALAIDAITPMPGADRPARRTPPRRR